MALEIGLFNFKITLEEMRENRERYGQVIEVIKDINEKSTDKDLSDAYVMGKILFKTRKDEGGVADGESVIITRILPLLLKRKISLVALNQRVEQQLQLMS